MQLHDKEKMANFLAVFSRCDNMTDDDQSTVTRRTRCADPITQIGDKPKLRFRPDFSAKDWHEAPGPVW
jgi:hypothetical protein